MNWEIFSTVGYISVGLWLFTPVLCVVYLLLRPWRWLGHVALACALAGVVLAEVNSATYVSRIRVDQSEAIQEQLSRQALARQAAQDERAGEVADIRFAEDATGDFYDKAGLSNTDRDYFDSLDEGTTPAWKQEKGQRNADGNDTEDLESLIGATEEKQGVEVAEVLEEKPEEEPILMSDKDKTAADRLDAANLNASQIVLLCVALLLIWDYVRRLNNASEVYFPLPVPSAWADALTPRQIVTRLTDRPKRSVADELKLIARRGEVFIYFTKNEKAAADVAAGMPALPIGILRRDVVTLGQDPRMDDAFVFESLWFARSNVVVTQQDRAQPMLERFVELLGERRDTRAHTRRTVHVVWDLPYSIPEKFQHHFAELARKTGFTLLIAQEPLPAEADA